MQNEVDECVFNKGEGSAQVTVVVYVDDLLMTAVNDTALDDIVDHLKSIFGEVTVCTGDIHSYVGMTMTFVCDADTVNFTMSGYVRDLVDHWQIKKTKASPAAGNLFEDV